MLDNVFDYYQSYFDRVKNSEKENIEKASDLIVESILDGGKIYIFGTGHSHMIAEEIYIRAGGLALVEAILPDEVMLHQMANKSTFVERLSGYSKELLELYELSDQDVLIIVSNSGRNNVVVEMALEAREKNIKTIGLTSLSHSHMTESRHESGKKLYELVDVALDNHAPKGDAVFTVGDYQLVPVSTFTSVVIIQAVIVLVVSRLSEMGVEVPVFKSSNLDEAETYNKELFKKYYGVRK